MNKQYNTNDVISKRIKIINQLVQNGDLLQALKKTESCISQNNRSLRLLKKYAYLHELAGNIEIAALLNISLQYYFPHHFDAKVAFLNFCFRNGKLKKVANKLEQWKGKYGEHKSYIESKIKLLKPLWAYEEAKTLTEQYIQKFPKEVFGYVNLIDLISNIRLTNYRAALEAIGKQSNAANFGFRIQRTLNQVQSSYVNTFQPNTKLQFTHHENSNQLLKSYFIKNEPKKDNALNYIFENFLNIKAIRALTATAIFSKSIHQQFLAYLEEYPKWKNYQMVKDYLAITTQNIGITALPEKWHPLPSKKVDIVYTWCDNSDETFRQQLNRLLALSGQKTSSSNNVFRYQQMGEIKLSLLSVQKYFSQVNNIYIVTNQQQFDIGFLNTSFQNKIQFIDHTQIMPKKLTDKGVFNSNLIETFIWKIPNLCECFLYFNDDVILGDYLKEEHIYNSENVPYTTLIPYHFKQHYITKDLLALAPETPFYEPCMYNAHQQFVNRFNIEPHLGPLHQFMIMTKTSCKALFQIMENSWSNSFFKDALRGNNSVYTVMMYNWYALLKGHQVLGPYHLYRRRSLYFHNEIYAENVETIQTVKPLFYCLNYVADATSKKLMEGLMEGLGGTILN